MCDVLVDSRDELWHAGEHTTTQAVLGDVSKKPLHHVQPGRRGWREMHVKSWMLVQPVLYHRMLMRGVVVNDQVQRFALGCLALDLL